MPNADCEFPRRDDAKMPSVIEKDAGHAVLDNPCRSLSQFERISIWYLGIGPDWGLSVLTENIDHARDFLCRVCHPYDRTP